MPVDPTRWQNHILMDLGGPTILASKKKISGQGNLKKKKKNCTVLEKIRNDFILEKDITALLKVELLLLFKDGWISLPASFVIWGKLGNKCWKWFPWLEKGTVNGQKGAPENLIRISGLGHESRLKLDLGTLIRVHLTADMGRLRLPLKARF